MKKVNWGIIGLGNVANKFADSFKFSLNANLLGISSNSKDKLTKFSERFKISKQYCFNNYEDILKCNEIDITYIALPNSLHFNLIKKCINLKKNFLVENPATINFEEIGEIYKKYKKEKFFFSEAFPYRYHPQIIKIIDLIKKNKIGKLISMESFFGNDILTSFSFFGFKIKKKIKKSSRLYNKELGGGAILDLGCYPVSLSTLIASLKSEFKKVNVVNKKKLIATTGVDIDSYAELIFDNGFTSKIGASFTKNLGRETKITGSEGEIIIKDTWFSQIPYLILKKSNIEKIKIDIDKDLYSHEIDFISKCILDGKNEIQYPGLTLNDTVQNMKIIDEWIK